MRKLLLATTALVGSVAFAGAGHAAPAPTSPITLNVGGYVDFVAGFYSEANGVTPHTDQTDRGFEDEFKVNFDALGKAANGMQYGANVSLWNGPEAANLWRGGAAGVELASAYVWMSGSFGKLMLGDAHGASDLFVYAPTVGEGQIDGRYMDFVSPLTLTRFYASGIDNTEHSTNITYYTPKVGNDFNKVQLGLTYEPNMYDYGSNVIKFDNQNAALGNSRSTSPYQDVAKADLAYTGTFHPVDLAISGQIEEGQAGNTPLSSTTLGYAAPAAGGTAMDFVSYGLGANLGIAGFTFGGSYNEMGHYMATHGQNKDQEDFTLGGKYEFDKVAVGASWLSGDGYNNLFAPVASGGTGQQIATTITNTNYVSSFNAYSVGATYTWFPGLTSAIDGTIFSQDVRDQRDHNDGYVLLVSQKMTF